MMPRERRAERETIKSSEMHGERLKQKKLLLGRVQLESELSARPVRLDNKLNANGEKSWRSRSWSVWPRKLAKTPM